MQTKSSIPTRQEYEARERAEFARQLGNTDAEGAAEFAKAMAGSPKEVAGKVAAMVRGELGFGAQDAARHVAANQRMDRAQWAIETVGAIGWRSPVYETRRNLKTMGKEARAALVKAVEAVISQPAED